MKTPRRRKPKLDDWEHALTCPLPSPPPYELLENLRQRVMFFLNWVTHDVAQGDPDGAVREIQRAADRLKLIASLTQAALLTERENYARQCRELEDAERKAQQGQK